MSKEVSNFDKSGATWESNMISAIERPVDRTRDHRWAGSRGSNTSFPMYDLMMANHVRVS